MAAIPLEKINGMSLSDAAWVYINDMRWIITPLVTETKGAYQVGWSKEGYSCPANYWKKENQLNVRLNHPEHRDDQKTKQHKWTEEEYLTKVDNIGCVTRPSRLVIVDVDDKEAFKTCMEFIKPSLCGNETPFWERNTAHIFSRLERDKYVFTLPEDAGELPHLSLVWPKKNKKPGEKDITVFELRCDGMQDMFPPSIHPDTHQPIVWRGNEILEAPADLIRLWTEWNEFIPAMERLNPDYVEPKRIPPKEITNAVRVSGVDYSEAIQKWKQKESLHNWLIHSNYTHVYGPHYIRPNSNSGKMSVWMYPDRMAFYTHSVSDRFYHKVADAFDLLVEFKFNGDSKEAYKFVLKDLGLWVEPKEWAKQKRAEEKAAKQQRKAPEPEVFDSDVEVRAKEIYESGEALEFMVDSCAEMHPGERDKRIIRAGLLSFAATKCENSGGIHLYVAGPAGSGKSHIIDTLLEHIPKDKQVSGSMSTKALFYDTDIQPGTVIAMDDQELSEEANNILKARTSTWDKPYVHRTVSDKTGLKLSIPERCPSWISKSDATGDEQTADRQLTMFADDSSEQKKIVRAKMADRVAHPKKYMDDTKQRISRKIWELMPDTYVVIPYADKIQHVGDDSNRNDMMIYSLIMSSCIMAASKREVNEEGGLIATKDDFMVAAKIMNPLLAGDGGSQKYKLSPVQQTILNYLKTHANGNYAYQAILADLVSEGVSAYTLSRAMNGRKADHSDGLQKIPGIDICQMDFDGQKNAKFINWNRDVFEVWSGSKAAITLEE